MRGRRTAFWGDWRICLPIVAVVSLFVYWMTAYRTVAWWDGSSYPLSAVTLGINNPPGSLLLTLLGWLVTRYPFGLPQIQTLNFLAGLLGTITICLGWIAAVKLGRITEHQNDRATSPLLTGIAVALGIMTLTFNLSVWRFAVKFTPYIMTTVFTAMIFLAMLNWYWTAKQKESWRYLFLAALLVGLDFSVHRTNSLLVPGIAVWMLLTDPRSLIRLRSWVAGLSGVLIGLAVQLFIIPIAAAHPPLNMGNPSNWSRFYDYVALKQYGGHWLLNLFPRKAPFWAVQVKDYINDFVAGFANTHGPLSYLGLLPALLGVIGIVALIRRNWRLGLGVLMLFLCTSFVAVFYFNLEADFFRPMDRHYMPSFVLFGILAAYGAGWLFKVFVPRLSKNSLVPTIVILTLIGVAPLTSALTHYSEANGSNRTFAHDFAVNTLSTADNGAILFIQGDVFWPVKYVTLVEQFRPDVSVISLPLLNTQWYVAQIIEDDSTLPLSLTPQQVENLAPTAWTDSTLVIAIKADSGSFHLDDDEQLPDSSLLTLPPTLADKYVISQDQVLFKLLQENEWRRPIYFNQPPEWLAERCRQEGLLYRLLPVDSAVVNDSLLEQNLRAKYIYSGWDLHTSFWDPGTKFYASQLKYAWLTLARDRLAQGDSSGACGVIDEMIRNIPNHQIGDNDNLVNLQRMIEKMADCELNN